MPIVWRGEGELKKEVFGEGNVPLNLLPSRLPPLTGKRKWASEIYDSSLMWAREKSERVEVAASFFRGDLYGDGGAISAEGELG